MKRNNNKKGEDKKQQKVTCEGNQSDCYPLGVSAFYFPFRMFEPQNGIQEIQRENHKKDEIRERSLV